MNQEPGGVGFAEADLERVRQVTFVRTVEHHPTLDSTNSRALRLAEDTGVDLPALVVTDLQTAGRGRGANQWWSASGALTFSLLLPRDNSIEETSWPRISLTAGLAVCDALQQLRPGLQIGLKWPNDVFVQSRKVCGILVEVPPRSPTRLVVGVGINVNNSVVHAPPPVAATAIALIDVAGFPFDLSVVLVRVLQQLATQLAAMELTRSALAHRWDELCMLTGLRIRVESRQRATAGICQGIDESGALLVDTASGRERCLSGVVTVLETGESAEHA